MDAFSLAYFIAVGLFVATVWALIIADAIGHYADRWGSRIRRMLARVLRLRFARGGEVQPWTPSEDHATTDPRTEHHR